MQLKIAGLTLGQKTKSNHQDVGQHTGQQQSNVAHQSAIARRPETIRMGDRILLTDSLDTSNTSHNHTITAGARLVVLEDGSTMFGADGYVRVHGTETGETGDWVRTKCLRASSVRQFEVGARVFVVGSASHKAPRRTLLADNHQSNPCAPGALGTIKSSSSAGSVVVRFDNGAGVRTLTADEAEDLAFVGGPLSYTSQGGSRVSIPSEMRPWAELGVPVGADRRQVKAAFQGKAGDEPSRQRRATLSLAYNLAGKFGKAEYCSMHPDGVVSFDARHPMVLAAAGALEGTGDIDLVRLLARDHRSEGYINKMDAAGESMLYKAARSGFYDVCKALLEQGAEVDQTQKTGSSALHAACFYGHNPVAQLLVSRGAALCLRNSFGNSPLDEAHSKLGEKLKTSLGASEKPGLFASAIRCGSGHAQVHEIKRGGTVVARKLFRVGANGKRVHRPSGYELAWHGTKATHVPSILKFGLRASGTKLPDGTKLEPPANHYGLGMAHQGISNWAGAIFVSPSVSYASHACYAERVMENGKIWAVVMDCAIKPHCFSTHSQTVSGGYTTLPGEPDSPEYRVEVEDDCEEQIIRVSKDKDLEVLGCTLIDVEFLEACGLSYEQLRKLIAANA